MELIEEIESRRDKKGILRKWGLFLCPYCLQKVEKLLFQGKRDKSCGCFSSQLIKENHVHLEGENHPLFGKIAWNKGKSMSEKSRKKLSESQKGHVVLNETRLKIGKFNKDKIVSEEARKKQSESMKSYYLKEENRQKTSLSLKGKIKFTEIQKKKLSEIQKTKKGILSPNWNNGSSFEPYGIEFNKELKKFVLERDFYICKDPNCEHLSERLDIHHIDYDKKNNSPENLITLCRKCHMKTNGKKRIYYTEFYHNILEEKCVSVS